MYITNIEVAGKGKNVAYVEGPDRESWAYWSDGSGVSLG